MVITPAASQAIMSQNGLPTVREMSAETMKMPEPIIDPATSMAASVRDKAFTNPPDDADASPVSGWLIDFLRAIREASAQNLRGGGGECQIPMPHWALRTAY